MAVSVYLERVIDELERNAQLVKEEELQAMADAILRAERVFVAGTGRTGFAARAFSNRLMQLGMTVYFVGEPTTPAIGSPTGVFRSEGWQTGSSACQGPLQRADWKIPAAVCRSWPVPLSSLDGSWEMY